MRILIRTFAIALVCLCIGCKENATNSPTMNTDKNNTTTVDAKLLYKAEAQLGEGAFWDSATSRFFWIDIEGKQLHIYTPLTNDNSSFPTPSRIGTVVPQSDTTAVVALEDGIYIMNTSNGDLTLLSDVEQTMTTNRFNDGKCDPNGNLWVGSMHLEQSAPEASVYKVTPTSEATKMIENVTISNGIVWTKDGSIMYYIDTPTGQIRAYDYDKASATISNMRVAVTVSTDLGFPDGMTIDENDHLWVGLWNGNAVAQFNPISGELISKIEVPAHNVTACAFGGPNLDKLYITTASVDMSPEEQERFPDAGSLFVATPGVRGVKSIRFGTK